MSYRVNQSTVLNIMLNPVPIILNKAILNSNKPKYTNQKPERYQKKNTPANSNTSLKLSTFEYQHYTTYISSSSFSSFLYLFIIFSPITKNSFSTNYFYLNQQQRTRSNISTTFVFNQKQNRKKILHSNFSGIPVRISENMN